MTKDFFINLEDKYGATNYKPLDVVISRAKGVWVWDVEGTRYLDCVAAYGAVNQGHTHPKILKALTEQAEKLSLISRAFRTDQIGPFYEELCSLTKSDRAILMNSGAEAVETALKVARKWAYEVKKVPKDKAEIIVCKNNFHGRTIAIVGFSSVDKYKKDFGPFPKGFKLIDFGDAEALKNAINENTAAFLVEPVQAEGGMNVPPSGYLKEVRKICSDNNVALIFDEIQSGLGRTGKLLTEEHEKVKADMVLVGKSLGGGFCPISAVLSRGKFLDVLKPGDHGSTFGGNPLACAIAKAALNVITEEKLCENAEKMGAYIKDEILKMKSPFIKDVRGLGLMFGIELTDKAGDSTEIINKLLANGLLCNKVSDRVIRFTPPLVISDEEANWAISGLKKVFKP